MDKHMVGQWRMEKMNETVNIFDETPLRAKLSFDWSGYFNVEPNCIYKKDGYLCWEINDETYRMVYHVKLEDDRLKGYTTQFNQEKPIEYVRISDVPEDAPYRHEPMEQFLAGVPRIDLLRGFADYDRTRGESYETEYVLGEAKPQELEEYGLSAYVDKAADPDDVAFRLLDFVCDHFKHNGNSGLPEKRGVEDLIAFCQANGGRINCRGLSLLLANLLRMQGIKARHITCMPCEQPFVDCHVVVDCLLPSGQRVMLDPTFRLYFKDGQGAYVSIPRLREMLIAGEEMIPNPEASYNGEPFDLQYYRHYMTKNTVRFSRGTLYTNGADDATQRWVELVPAKYPVSELPEENQRQCVYGDELFWQM